MAKMASLAGSVVGKIGGNVYSVSAGQQLVRSYQPNVANPQTELQVDNRTKFKLASQLAAAVSPVLAISKKGLVSGRNQFVSATMGAITFALGEATVHLNKLQLTNSSITLPSVQASRGQGGVVSVQLGTDVTIMGVTKVVYVRFVETSNNKLMLVGSQVVSVAGSGGDFPTEFTGVGSGQTIFYAYGIIESENSILAKYDNYQVAGAEFIATLISSRSGIASGIQTTTTSCAVLSPA